MTVECPNGPQKLLMDIIHPCWMTRSCNRLYQIWK